MKILWLHEILGPQGGAETNVVSTARALRERGHENFLLHRRTASLGAADWAEVFSPIQQVNSAEEVLARAATLSPEVIWIHNWAESSLFPRLRESGHAVARMVHDHSLYCMRQYKYHPLTRRNCARPASLACLFPCLAFLQRSQGRWPVRLASLGAKLREIADNRCLNRLVVASAHMRAELLGNGFAPEKIRILPPVPPPPTTAPTGPAEGESPPCWDESGAGELLFCGQILRGKGVDYLLRAVAHLTIPWHLTIAGEGSALPKCRALAKKLGVADRVRFLGHLSAEALDQAYRRASVVVVPSAWAEPFGMVGIEAMRRARPVVGFRVGGIPDWLHHEQNGLLVPPADPGALAAALTDLLAHPERARAFGLQGWKLCQSDFSFLRGIDNLEKLLHEISPSFHSSLPSRTYAQAPAS